MRNKKPFSAGLPGASYRPSTELSLGARAHTTTDPEDILSQLSEEEEQILNQAKLSYRSFTYVVFAHIYPFQKSGFFVGLAAAHMERAYSYSVSSENEEGSISIASDHQFGAGLVGFDWIWENGFTLGVDAGNYYRISGGSRHETPSSKGLYESGQGHEIRKIVDDLTLKVPVRCRWFIGYSF
jgi:hypothetical protein